MKYSSYIQENNMPGMDCGFNDTDGYYMSDMHWHPYYEVLVIRTVGNYTISNSGSEYSGTGPAVFIQRPYTPHRLCAAPDERYERYIINIDRSSLKGFPDVANELSLYENACLFMVIPTESELRGLCAICENILDASKRRDRVDSVLFKIMLLHHISMLSDSGHNVTGRKRLSYIQDVLQYVSENLSERITLGSVCERFGVGRTKFSEDFTAATGVAFKKYLTDLRQIHARELIADGSSVINASLEAGYTSEAHFIKIFREYWGMTPGEFRSSLKN
ncbi:MAG: AraC family transcriptional regulator [Eubacteriales bacterium]